MTHIYITSKYNICSYMTHIYITSQKFTLTYLSLIGPALSLRHLGHRVGPPTREDPQILG